jgi:myosin-5
LLKVLERRFLDDSIYTFAGDVLVSLNPYRMIPHMYDLGADPVPTEGEGVKPHVFTTAARAIDALFRVTGGGDDKGNKNQNPNLCQNQSILVNGESGAGKTEAAKQIMRYLTHASASGRETAAGVEDGAGAAAAAAGVDGAAVEACVLQSNVILEAFGNAKTIRNDNSSRFGKFIRLEYAEQSIVGASTSHFMLEKTRIVQQSEGERNYHVFYQLCRGLDEAKQAQHRLKPVEEYRYLVGGNETRVGGVDDSEEFALLVTAMETMKIGAEDRDSIFATLSGILALGNIEFVDSESGIAKLVESEAVQDVAHLLGVTTMELQRGVCQRTVSAGRRSSFSVVPLTADQARDCVQGLTKALYAGMFGYLVDRINSATDVLSHGGSGGEGGGGGESKVAGAPTRPFIGILDIFGFEVSVWVYV